MSAATREAEQPGKEFQVAEQRLKFKRSQHLHALTQKKNQSVCSCSIMFSFKVHCFKVLEFPSSWMACIQEERGATPRISFSERQDKNYLTNIQKRWKHTHERSCLQYFAPPQFKGLSILPRTSLLFHLPSSSSERLFFASLGLDDLTCTSRVLHIDLFFPCFFTQEMVLRFTWMGPWNLRPAQAQYMR